jgi:molybdopterin-guanine dinucleotide biosynthesis protein A
VEKGAKPAMLGVTAFILAGGKSTRMGRDKAFVPWEGRTLLERALEVTHTVSSGTRIVGAKTKFEEYGIVVEDIYPDRGPLAGIHAALRASDKDLNLVLAVDLPFVTPALLSYLVDRALETHKLAIVPRLAAGWEPLCAVYRKEFADVAEEALLAGRNAIHPLLECGHVRAMDEGELAAAGFPAEMFRNVNTLAELASSQERSSK